MSDEDRNKQGNDYSSSIITQKNMLMSYSIDQGWDIHKIYIDDDYSGGNQNRPAFKELIADCENHNIDIVLCKSQSRFSREMEVIEEYLHKKFVLWGIRFIGYADGADTDKKENKKSRQINGLVNEWYLEDLSENVRTSLKIKMKKGEFIGSFAPYGYMKDPNDKHKLIIDPVASKVVKRIFDLYTDGYGVVSICRLLNDEKILSPSQYKSQNSNYYNISMSANPKTQIWTASTVTRMIINEVYIGTLVQGKHENVSYKCHKKKKVPKDKQVRIENNHEPIISLEIWNMAQSMRKSNSKNSNAVKTNILINPIGAKLYCSECGRKLMREHAVLSDGTSVDYAACPTRRTAKTCSNSVYARFDYIEKIIIDEINKLLTNYYDETLIKVNSDCTQEGKSNELSKRLKQLTNRLSDKQNKLFKLYEDKLDGKISDKQYETFSKRFEIDICNFENQIEEVKSLIAHNKNQSEQSNDKHEILSKYKHIDTLDKYILNEFIDKIYVSKNKNKQVEVLINWKI